MSHNISNAPALYHGCRGSLTEPERLSTPFRDMRYFKLYGREVCSDGPVLSRATSIRSRYIRQSIRSIPLDPFLRCECTSHDAKKSLSPCRCTFRLDVPQEFRSLMNSQLLIIVFAVFTPIFGWHRLPFMMLEVPQRLLALTEALPRLFQRPFHSYEHACSCYGPSQGNQ